MKKHQSIFISGLCAALALMVSCSGSSSSTGSSSSGGASGTPAGGIVDQSGLALSNVDTNDPVYLSLSGLTANSPYSVTVTAPDGSELNPEGGFVATTDEDGNIPTSTLLQDLSTTSSGSSLVLWSVLPEPRLAAQEGDYQIVVRDADGEEIMTDTFAAVDNDKVFCADSAGTARASFLPSETVFARVQKGADGDLADGSYTCYVFSDLNAVVENGDALAGSNFTMAVTDGVGSASLGVFSSGQYDVVCDINANSAYDAGTDLIARPGRFRPCFTIQEANSGDDIIGQVCADRNGNYRDVFDPNADDQDIRDVWAWISPPERSLVEHATGVRKYVVGHQDSWADGDDLNDVTGDSATSSFEVDSVQGFCTNEAPWLVWPRQRMRQGCFDCIIDVNANGVYDQGTDFVDNIDNSGDNSTCGMRVTDSSCAEDAVVIASNTDGETVDATAITLTGTFATQPASASVTVSSGSQSNTINVDVSNVDAETGVVTFSAAIPLFSGENHLTVTAITSGTDACADTIVITSSSTASQNELFRAQMTWDGDTDMDLHMVRPGGSYSNGGGGVDDCNYSNCKVGLDASTENSIDWGDDGETDDPKLDVDCIACGSGIENIWMNGISEDGDYEVFIDAFSGSESAVNVGISIRGASVGTVSCGAMSAGSDTDSCFVGTITWSGGDSGSGTFTPAGTKAATF